MIDRGACVDDRDNGKNKWTPLIYASLNRHKGVAKLLIKKGADVNAKDAAGNTWVSVIYNLIS